LFKAEVLMKKILIISALFFVFSMPVIADYRSDLASGEKAYKAGDYAKAFEYFSLAFVQQPSPGLQEQMQGAYRKSHKEPENHPAQAVKQEAAPVTDKYRDWAAQENLISYNPLYLMYHVIDLHYERKISGSLSIGLDAGYNFGDSGYDIYGSWSSRYSYGYNAGASLNWYKDARPLNGFFAGIEFAASYFHYYSPDNPAVNNYETLILASGPRCGYRWIVLGGFSADLTLTVILYNQNTSKYGTQISYFLPQLGVNMGYAF
jgi:hypothetical protein